MSGIERRKKVVVLGAGVTGLSAAYRLSRSGDVQVDVVEKEALPGGVCRSFTEGDFILDHGPHKFYTLIDGILDELCALMGDDLLERDKTQSLYFAGKYFSFPLKMSEMVLKFPPTTSAQVLLSYAAQILKNQFAPKQAITYEDFIVERFGRGLYQQIFEPMARKVFGAPEGLDRKLAEVRVSTPGLMAVIKQVLFKSKVDRTVSAPMFHYPKYGYGMIPQRLQEKSEANGAKYHLGAKVLKIETKDGKASAVVIENKNGETVRLECDYIVYTIPLSALEKLLMSEVSPEIREATRFVSYRHSIIYYYLLKSEPVLPAIWVFCPESKFRFGRLSEMVKFSPHTAPPGHTSLMVDFTCEGNDPVWSMDDKALGEMLYQQLEPMKLFGRPQILKSFSKRFPNLYPTYSVGYQKHIAAIRSLEKQLNNLFFIGRLGDFNYNNADQCLDMGFRAADHIIEKGGVDLGWQQLRSQQFEQYKIVD